MQLNFFRLWDKPKKNYNLEAYFETPLMLKTVKVDMVISWLVQPPKINHEHKLGNLTILWNPPISQVYNQELRQFEFLAGCDGIFWSTWIETSGALLSINMPMVSIYGAHTTALLHVTNTSNNCADFASFYRTRPIITRRLYTFYPLFEVQKRFFKEIFS